PPPSGLRRLAEMPLTPDTLWVDSADTVVVESERTSDVFEAARTAGSAVELVTALRISFGKVDGELDPRGRFVLESADDLPAAERWLLKFHEARCGAALDFGGDNAVHVAVFSCMALGWSVRVGAAWPLLLGTVACASTLLAATAEAPHLLTPAVPGAPRSAGARL